MAKVNLKSIYTSADKFTILQLLEEFVKKVDAIDFPSDEEMAQAQEDIETLKGNVTTLDGNITTLSGDITALTGRVEQLETFKTDLTTYTIPALTERIGKCEGDITALDGRVTALETSVITKLYKHSVTVNVGSDNYLRVEVINSSNTQLTLSTFDKSLLAGRVVMWGGTGFFVLTGDIGQGGYLEGLDISDSQAQPMEVALTTGLSDVVTALN